MTAKLRTVFFDIDDTLFDRNRAQRGILHLIIRELRDVFVGIDEKRIVDAFLESDRVTTQEYETGISTDGLRTRRSKLFLSFLGLSEGYADKITAMYVNLYPTVDAPVRDAKSVIETLAGRFQLGVISNGLPDVQYRKLETLDIKHLFDCIVLSEELGIRKPDPELFWHATSMLGREPEECLYVGDSYDDDVVGAKRAGMKACWFNPHGFPASQLDTKPEFEIHALDEILEFLDCAEI